MTTNARLDGDHYVLNGAKTLISNGGLADQYVVFCRTEDAPGREASPRWLSRPTQPVLMSLNVLT